MPLLIPLSFESINTPAGVLKLNTSFKELIQSISASKNKTLSY